MSVVETRPSPLVLPLDGGDAGRMANIREPVLSVESVPEHASRREVRVVYELVLEPENHLVGREVEERIAVHAVDEHDAAVRPQRDPIVVWTSSFTGVAGVDRREASEIVEQTALDVVKDWWSSGPGGEVRPIAEWSDHIAADISLSTNGRVVASVTTPTVTGSWGPLGDVS